MNKTRTHLAVIAMVASMTLLAACSKGEDETVSGTTTSESPAVVTPPAPVTPEPTPAPEVTPAPDVTPAPVDSTVAPATTTDRTEAAKQSAKDAADNVADKAAELKDAAAAAAKRAGDAIKEGADKADSAIQDKVGDGTATDNPTSPSEPQS